MVAVADTKYRRLALAGAQFSRRVPLRHAVDQRVSRNAAGGFTATDGTGCCTHQRPLRATRCTQRPAGCGRGFVSGTAGNLGDRPCRAAAFCCRCAGRHGRPTAYRVRSLGAQQRNQPGTAGAARPAQASKCGQRRSGVCRAHEYPSATPDAVLPIQPACL